LGDERGPEGLRFRSHYWDDREAKEEFKTFLLAIHGLDLSLWERRGFWDDLYVPYSLFDGKRIVSSVCLYTMEMVIGGKRRRLAQFSGVGTLFSHRRRGLGKWLTLRAIERGKTTHDGFFLFATEAALVFYGVCGFRPADERAEVVSVECRPSKRTPRRLDLDLDQDLRMLYELARARSPVSDLLGTLNPKLLMFHALYGLRGDAYHIPDLDAVVLCRVDGRRLVLFDVIGERVPSFAEIHPHLSHDPHDEVMFRFMPDKMRIRPERAEPLSENHLHLLPPLELPRPGCPFPFVAQA